MTIYPEPTETAECPGCHEEFHAPKGQDPLKHHLPYCDGDYLSSAYERTPEDEDAYWGYAKD